MNGPGETLNLNSLKSKDVPLPPVNATPEQIKKPEPIKAKVVSNKVDITQINRKDKAQTPLRTPYIRKRSKTYVIAFLIFLFTNVLIVGLYYFDKRNSEDFYIGEFQMQLSDSERTQGIKGLTYTFNKTFFTEDLEIDNNGVRELVRIKNEITLVEQKRDSIKFAYKTRKVESFSVALSTQSCPNNDCDSQKKTLEKNFRDKIEQQSNKLDNKLIKLSALSNDSLKLESSIDGIRVLEKK